jgi:hypothetical protein
MLDNRGRLTYAGADMKHIPFASLLLASAAFAGTEVAPAPMPPAAEPSLWSWFVGGSVGYLLDSEEWLYTAHVGAEVQGGSGLSHAFYLEGGYAEWDEEDKWALPDGEWDGIQGLETDAVLDLTAELEIIPVTFNYKLEGAFSDTLKWYVGAGAGVAFVDFGVDGRIYGDVTGRTYDNFNRISDDDTVFAGQVFAGLIWEVSDCFEVFGGVRYIYVDDPEFKFEIETADGRVTEEVDTDVELDDVLIEAGCRFTF